MVGLFTAGWDIEALAGDEESGLFGCVKPTLKPVRSVSHKKRLVPG